jgi:murein L,D-transpeptidase YcbB/YkuD
VSLIALTAEPGWTAPAARADLQTPAPVRERLREILEGEPADLAALMLDGNALRRFYEKRQYNAVWVNSAERTTLLGTILVGAADHALEDTFPPAALVTASRLPPPERELALTQLALAYAATLATGRARSDRIETDWAIAPPAFDPVAGLEKALATGKLAEWFAALPPRHPAYTRLQSALFRYRQVAREGGWPSVPAGPTLKPGTSDPRIVAVRKRLVVTGDLLPDAASENDPTLDGTVETAIRAFQARHGIVPDGAVGAKTLAQMNVPVKARIEQIALNLERWRELPRDFGRNAINVNVPAAAFELVADGQTMMTMKTVVGDPGHPTPVLQTAVRAIVFNPAWRIPGSIYTKEILPKLKKDRQYLAKNDMIFVPEQGLQQLPGPKNPLGQIKFETPNKFDVYLHDTPSKKTFERWARAQSHGCVRLEHARDLAVFFLQMAQWPAEEVDAAVAAGTTQRVELKSHWRVNLLYATAFASPDGTIEFRDDMYGRDKRLKEALATARALPALESASDKPKLHASLAAQ